MRCLSPFLAFFTYTYFSLTLYRHYIYHALNFHSISTYSHLSVLVHILVLKIFITYIQRPWSIEGKKVKRKGTNIRQLTKMFNHQSSFSLLSSSVGPYTKTQHTLLLGNFALSYNNIGFTHPNSTTILHHTSFDKTNTYFLTLPFSYTCRHLLNITRSNSPSFSSLSRKATQIFPSKNIY